MQLTYPHHFPELVSSSTIGTYAECPRKFFLSVCNDLRPSYENIHFRAGRAYADSMNVFRRTYHSPLSPNKGDLDMALALAFKSLFEAYAPETISVDKWETVSSSPKSLANMACALVATIETYNPADPTSLLPVVDADGEVWAERTFSLETQVLHPDTGNPILYSGRTDCIVASSQGNYIMDEKSTSSMGEQWHKQWDLRAQFIGYKLGFWSNFPNLNGVVVRGVCLLKESIRLQEYIVNVPSWLVKEWWTDLNYMLADAVRDYKRLHFRAARDKACTSFSGCDFLSICTKAPEHRESFIRPAFVLMRYNPLTGEAENVHNAGEE